jgi:hypothetical protein
MRDALKHRLMWLYTILIVPVVIILTFWANGYFRP